MKARSGEVNVFNALFLCGKFNHLDEFLLNDVNSLPFVSFNVNVFSYCKNRAPFD